MTDHPRPRLNHVAMTVPKATLDEQGREAIIRFYKDVFGWLEIPQMTADRERLVLMIGGWTDFVFLFGSDDPATFTASEHFGVQTDTLEQFHEIRERIEAFQRLDDRVELETEEPQVFGDAVELHSYYVRYLLPQKVEVQHYVMTDESTASTQRKTIVAPEVA